MALMVCSSVVCVTGVGSGVEESVHGPLHSQSSHQSEELPPLMGATKEQMELDSWYKRGCETPVCVRGRAGVGGLCV